ncbi:sensor histidine kinase, partial [Dysgonomonas mossii]|uniref:sensor histidine kinase n=1 Tax=Dysgonomonas mossii TaxID=163665 RepID=UPI001AD11A1E
MKNLFGINEIENIGSINEDDFSRLWIGHNSGIAVYDYSNNDLKDYMLENSSGIIENTTVTDIYKTKNNHMVVGTYFSGLFYINELISPFEFYNFSNKNKEDRGIAVNGILEDMNDQLWIATNRSGINVIDRKGDIIRQVNQYSTGINNNIVSIQEDSSGSIWAGALSNGLYKIDKNGHISHYLSNPNEPNSISGNTIYGLRLLNQDSLIIATNKGVDIYSFLDKSFSNIISTQDVDFAFYNIHIYGNYVYIIDAGFIVIFNRKDKKVTKHNLNDIFPDIRILSSIVTSKGNLLLGTNKGQIIQYKDNSAEPYLMDNEQMNGSIVGLQIDRNGNIWAASGNYLFCIKPNKDVKKINLNWGMGKNEFNVRSSFSDKDGIIYFGTTDGYVKFNPQKIIDYESQVPQLYIVNFKIFNKIVNTNDDLRILTQHIDNTTQIKLKNNQNFISFEISLIDFSLSKYPYSLRYKLNNFEENWNEVNSSSNEISYTGLPPGKYTLIIQLLTDKQISYEKKIEIIITPPFYLNWYMILVYILLFSIVIYTIYRQIYKQKIAKKMLEEAKEEQEKSEKINSLKLDFFTYISHEFKTPLSIISTLQDEIVSSVQNENVEVDIFKRNVKRLEYLISQLIEFRSIESQHKPIKYTKLSIVSFIQEISKAFIPLCRSKNIKFDFLAELNEFEMILDAEKVEMLIGNLLVNRIKHTPTDGLVYLKITKEGEMLRMDIFNSGECLTEEQKQIIFEPYNRMYSSDNYANSGVSLAIVDSIAKLLNIK